MNMVVPCGPIPYIKNIHVNSMSAEGIVLYYEHDSCVSAHMVYKINMLGVCRLRVKVYIMNMIVVCGPIRYIKYRC